MNRPVFVSLDYWRRYRYLLTDHEVRILRNSVGGHSLRPRGLFFRLNHHTVSILHRFLSGVGR